MPMSNATILFVESSPFPFCVEQLVGEEENPFSYVESPFLGDKYFLEVLEF
jgi:hypothetical protein